MSVTFSDPKMVEERNRVLDACEFTSDEADAWILVYAVANAMFRLPEQHPAMDRAEVATAIHALQEKLLRRPAYRKYLESKRRPELHRDDRETIEELGGDIQAYVFRLADSRTVFDADDAGKIAAAAEEAAAKKMTEILGGS